MTSTGPERVIGSRSKAGKSECHAVHLVPFWCPTGHNLLLTLRIIKSRFVQNAKINFGILQEKQFKK